MIVVPCLQLFFFKLVLFDIGLFYSTDLDYIFQTICIQLWYKLRFYTFKRWIDRKPAELQDLQ